MAKKLRELEDAWIQSPETVCPCGQLFTSPPSYILLNLILEKQCFQISHYIMKYYTINCFFKWIKNFITMFKLRKFNTHWKNFSKPKIARSLVHQEKYAKYVCAFTFISCLCISISWSFSRKIIVCYNTFVKNIF